MGITNERNIERKDVLSNLSYDYIVSCLLGNDPDNSDLVESRIIRIFTRYAPELKSQHLKSLFESIPKTEIELEDTNVDELRNFVIETSKTYGLSDLVYGILDKMNTKQLLNLSTEVTKASLKFRKNDEEAEKLIRLCEGTVKILSFAAKTLDACSSKLPMENKPEPEAHIRKIKELIENLNKISEPFKRNGVEDNINKIKIAYDKFKYQSDLATDAINKANNLVKSLEQKDLLRQNENNIPKLYHIETQQDVLELIKTIEKVLND